jgi:hypothetical protein
LQDCLARAYDPERVSRPDGRCVCHVFAGSLVTSPREVKRKAWEPSRGRSRHWHLTWAKLRRVFNGALPNSLSFLYIWVFAETAMLAMNPIHGL